MASSAIMLDVKSTDVMNRFIIGQYGSFDYKKYKRDFKEGFWAPIEQYLQIIRQENKNVKIMDNKPRM